MNLAAAVSTMSPVSTRKARTGRHAVDLADNRAVLTLDGRGRIHDCNPSCEALFQYDHSELISRDIATLVPALAKTSLIVNGQPNPSLRFYCRVGYQFEAVTQHGDRFITELSLNLIDSHGDGRLTLIVRPTTAAEASQSHRTATDS